ncbi:MAG: alpha/beta hydrolase [Burkholderiaceae bacterium]
MAFHLIGRIAVDDVGEGPALVCVHGLGGSANTFLPLMPALQRHRVISLDLPGSARSQGTTGILSIEYFVDSILEICKRLEVLQAHWVAHSMGTIVCQHLAVAYPKLVKSLTFLGPLITPSEAAREGLKLRAVKARNEGLTGMQEITHSLIATALSNQTRQRSPLAVAFVRESLMCQPGEGYARSCEALAGSKAAAIEQIKAPVLLITGDQDGVAPPQAVRSMADKFHNSKSVRSVVLKDCGHWTPIEKPEDCQRELGEFLMAQARS